jgi:hypothetical protein
VIIEAGSAQDARELARKLLTAAARPGDVRTVHRGSRIAFDVPDELGRAVGRQPDTHADSSGADSSGADSSAPSASAPPAFVEPAADEPAAGEPPPKKTRRKVH